MTRVMFVDDEPAILRALARTFRSRRVPWEIELIGSGCEAVERLAKRTFDVVVADMRIPDLSGIEILERVQRETPGVVRMILSGQVGTAESLATLRIAHQCLAKPCSVEKLHRIVDQIMTARGAVGELASAITGIMQVPAPRALWQEVCAAVRHDSELAASAGAIVPGTEAALALAVQERALVVAGVARAIASPEHARDAYLVGLLHEIGTLALVSIGRDPEAGAPQVGGYLLALWGFPSPIVDAVATRSGVLGSVLRSATDVAVRGARATEIARSSS